MEKSVVSVDKMNLVSMAVNKDFDLDRLTKLMELQERWEAREAKKAFVAAMASFKANPPEVVKKSKVDFQSGKGRVNYKYATLHDCVGVIVPALSRNFQPWNTVWYFKIIPTSLSSF